MADHDSVVLDPPQQVYLFDEEGQPVLEPLRRLEDVAPGLVVCFRNPWRPDEFARALVRGQPDAVVLEVGNSLGSLELDDELGWVCRGLVKKHSVFSGLAEEMVEKATEAAYTDELMKKMAGKK